MDGFIEHKRVYCDTFNGATFKIVMKQGREQTATLHFSGSSDDAVCLTLDENDPIAYVKVYTQLQMHLLTSFDVVIPKDHGNFPTLSKARTYVVVGYSVTRYMVAEKKTCMDIECLRKNKSDHDELDIPVVMKYRGACFLCFSINDSQRSEVVLECCLSRTAPERIEQRTIGGYRTHGQVDVMACWGKTFKIVMQDESEHTAEINFAELYQEIDLQVKSFTQTLVTVVVYECDQYGSKTIKRFTVDRRGHLMDFQENINSKRGKLPKTHDAMSINGRTKEIQSTDDATNVRASNMALIDGLLSSSSHWRIIRLASCVKLYDEVLHAFSNKYNFSARSFAMRKSQKEMNEKLRNRKKLSPKTARLKRKASSKYKKWDSHMSSLRTMYVSSTIKKRTLHDWLQHTSFTFKRLRHPTLILSKTSVEKKDIPMNTTERPCEVLPEAYKKEQHPPAASIQVDYVRNDAKMFKVYSYVRRRIDEAIVLCGDEQSSSKFCSASIWIIFSDDQSTSGNNFCEAFTDIQRGSIESILDKDPSVIVSIGKNEECFATLGQKSADKPMTPIICKITPTFPTDTNIERKSIHRPWGFELFTKDLSKDNVVAYVDDVLEYYAFEVLDRATKHLPGSGEITSRVIAQVQSFHDEYMPMPEILKRENLGKKITKMEMISKQVLALPQVFACDISESTLRVMMLQNDETAREEVANNIKMMGLSDEDFFLQIVDIQPLAKIESGSQVYACGSPRRGTLGGFAKFTYSHIDTTHDVAITAKHVVDIFEPLTLCVNNQTIGPVLEDRITYDIAIARVTANKDKYETRFRNENEDLCFADLYHENIQVLKNKAVHFYGATTGLAKANISGISIGTSFEDDYNLITIGKQNKSALAAPGDSGAMILLERNPRCPEKNMYALGTLVGEFNSREEQGADTSRPKLPVKNETEKPVQLTKNPTYSGKPMQTENPKQVFTPSAHTISFQNAVPSEDQYQTTIPTHADDTRHPENPMTLEDTTNSENHLSTEDKMSSECSLPINDDASRHGSTPSSNTHKTYLIVPLKKAFDQLSKKHGGRFSLFTK
ncbi:uncharacterized protein LOC128240779 [Mya arenaria]|uniref:uncharacterized protein LOC128240779 n=1 Tax=Mya arenaria TaxID=6604 RepID=UPI0022E26C26|nr:uncharacterized protein LOC128240779 [Mya arenaria]